MASWDSTDWRAERDKKLLEWFKGDTAAVACLVAISSACEVWDDLVDGDLVTTPTVENMFIDLFLNLNVNPFFLHHRAQITAMMAMIINAWQDANSMAKLEDQEAHIKAYVLRNLGLELIPVFAYFIGGYSHMRSISMEMRTFVAHETFDQWEREHV